MNISLKLAFINAFLLCFTVANKTTSEPFVNYTEFFNYGDGRLSKIHRNSLRNDVFKLKIDVLGKVFKKRIDGLKSWGKLDVIFLIDASSSVGEENFKNEIKFVKKLLSDVTVDYDHTRIAIVTFSSKNSVIKNVDEISKPRRENNKCLLLNNQLGNIKYTGGGTYTLGAFKVAKKIFEKSRNESNKVLFLITDGFSNGGDPVPLADELKKNDVKIFTVGIKNGNYEELYRLSSEPGELFSYLLDSFQEFESLARRALHVDMKSGDYIPLGTNTLCNTLCDKGNCCDKNAICTCGTSTGHYTCLCQPGYYGSGLKHACSPCPSGTFSDGPNLCLPCPDVHHRTVPPANSIQSCKCKDGYTATKSFGCEIIRCTKLHPPKHGYFVKRKECGNVLNTACGVRCEVGYSLIGSSIRLCQTTGNWSGSSPSCQVKTCTALPIPTHGKISCTHDDLGITYNASEPDLPVDTVCTFSCDKGSVLIGSPQRTCLPLAQWDGLKTSCKQIKCNKLSNIPFGQVEPKSCIQDKQTLGSTCVYTCDSGFKLSGPKERSCSGKHGSWSTKSIQTICEDVTAPNLVCPKDIKANTISGKKFGTVFWNMPNVIDNSGLNVSVWLKPTIDDISLFKFPIGETTLTYFAQDPFKNIAQCNFTVKILDNEPPTIESCIDPVTFLSGDKLGANINWDEPDIFDNSGYVTVQKSHEFGFFEVGLTTVKYIAMDPSNNTKECLLNITVQESECEALPDPIHGQSECMTGNNGIECVVTCQEGYAIPISSPIDTLDMDNSSTQFICQHSDPIWYSEQNSIFPDCTITQIPTQVSRKGVVTLQSKSDMDICNNTGIMRDVVNEIQNNLYVPLYQTCFSDLSCNFDIRGMCENEDDSHFEEETNIIKREISPIGKSRKYQLRKVNVEFQVTAYVTNTKNLNTSLKSLNEIDNIPFLKGNPIASVISVNVNKANIVCPNGFLQRHLKCVPCPKGSFHNKTLERCQSCPLGFYNDKVGQHSCIICPLNHSTTKLGCKSMKDCKAHCPPGTHSRRKKLKPSKHHPNTTIDHMTLMPHCRACAVGYYQSNYGQLSCRSCPYGQTTNSIRSSNTTECISTAKTICDTYPNICHTGKCIAENDFYYSCLCDEKHVGSHCETRVISACSSNPCLNNGTCVLNELENGYFCACKDGFTGIKCEEIEDKCEKRCYNNGICVKNDEEEQICICPDGYGGESCEIKLQFCSFHLCENNGKCVEELNSYKCICENGFIGKRCNILPCDYQPCSKQLTCVNINRGNATRYSYKCECPKGYQGKTCKDQIDYCLDNPCLNNGICTNLRQNFSCECPKAYFGDKCEFKRSSDYILNFPRSGTTDFVQLDGFIGNLSQISVCLWMLSLDTFNYGTILSYATYEYDNAFTLTDYTGIVLYINGHHAVTDVLLNDGIWHFICVTWESLEGTYNIYLDGKMVENGTGLASGQLIEDRGKMVIGQEQDVLGGRFSQSESFLGKIAYLDVWKRALTQAEIENYMNSCSDNILGDLYAWVEIKDFVHGEIEIITSTFCKACENPDQILDGSVQVIDNVAFYSCNSGYALTQLQSTFGRRCTKSSEWEGNVEPACKRVYCGYPGYLFHGKIIGTSYYYLDSVKYICNKGYNLVGPSDQICMENGTWSHTKPSCIGVQCTNFIKPDNSNIFVVSDSFDQGNDENKSDFDVGTQLEIECLEDAKIEGESLLTCLDNGTWDNPIPKCIVEKIAPLQASNNLPCPIEQMSQPPENGYAVLESINSYKNGSTDTVEFKCRQGYYLHGDNFTTCILDGYWTEPNVSCDPILCGKPPSFPKLTVNDAHLFNDTYQFGNMVTFKCIDGYKIMGTNGIRCLANGKWSKMQAKCARISCFKPIIKQTTRIEGNSYFFPNNLTLICSKGNKYIITCSSSGDWIGHRGNDC